MASRPIFTFVYTRNPEVNAGESVVIVESIPATDRYHLMDQAQRCPEGMSLFAIQWQRPNSPGNLDVWRRGQWNEGSLAYAFQS